MHRIVGLDVAANELRMVALQSGFRGFAVADVRRVPLPEAPSLAERLSAAVSQLPPMGDDAIAVALPAAQVASFVFTLPFVDSRRVEQVLPAEVEGAIPFDLEDVVWDHAVLSQGDGKTEVLVAVVKKTALQGILGSVAEAGIDLPSPWVLSPSASSSPTVAKAPPPSSRPARIAPPSASCTGTSFSSRERWPPRARSSGKPPSATPRRGRRSSGRSCATSRSRFAPARPMNCSASSLPATSLPSQRSGIGSRWSSTRPRVPFRSRLRTMERTARRLRKCRSR